MSNSNRILVVDDEQGMRELLEIVLGNDGYEVTAVASPEEAQALLKGHAYDVVITDLRIGNDREAGMRFLSWLREFFPATPTLMMTAHGSVETAIEAMKRGATDYVLKPFQNDEIRLLVERSIEQREIVRENKVLRKEQAKLGAVTNMIGASAAIEQVKEMIRRVAVLPSTIAISGESGTGKELVARNIHQLSERSDRPFVAINCGGIPENLLESELFGHKKGAFTGAVLDKEGLFVAADGGTLFLDEIGEMPLSLQVKLLRVLDDSIVTPLGATETIQVDMRIVSATNRDLQAEVHAGRFREDLYYRLSVIPLIVPSLRERVDDIPLLIRHFVDVHGQKMNREDIEVSPEAKDALCSYLWPGNVRELGNVIERGVALCGDDTIDLGDLPQNIRDFVPAPSGNVAELPSEGLDLEELISEIEIKLIQEALQRTKHSQKRAARLLGLTPRSLRYRLQKYGLGSAVETVEV